MFAQLISVASVAGALMLSATSLVAAPRTGEAISAITAPTNVDAKKVSLGKMLFFDPRLSKSATISCNSCHNLGMGGDDNRVSSIGHGWNIGPINSPTVYNAGYGIAQFWDGRAKDLKEQAGGPVANPGEMGSTHELAVKVLNSIPTYRQLFQDTYGKSTIEIGLVQDAIAAFEETLVTPNSRFDQWLAGNDSALTAEESKGYELFKNTGCVSCHNGAAVGGGSYQKLGLVKTYAGNLKKGAQLGRYNVTKLEADKFVFKVPTLRNVEHTAPYFHDGSVWTLEEAATVMADVQLGKKLTTEESKLIASFLRTLTGDFPKVEFPQLPASTAETPKPNDSLMTIASKGKK